jgi:hypothetical protein
MVDDLVGLSPSNHGTLDAIPVCAQSCAPAFWQQRSNAAFIGALNSAQETFPGISYTNIYTDTDEVVVPNVGPAASSSLSGGGGAIANIATQSVCPADLTEHVGIGIYDNTAYQLALDALTHPGPANPSRVAATTCLSPLMPGYRPRHLRRELRHYRRLGGKHRGNVSAHDVRATAGLLRERDVPDRAGRGSEALRREAGPAVRAVASDPQGGRAPASHPQAQPSPCADLLAGLRRQPKLTPAPPAETDACAAGRS